MAIIRHEQLKNTIEQDKPALEVREQAERPQLTYDPGKLPTLTAYNMKDIEDTVWKAQEDGAEPAELQQIITQRLESIGIDPEAIVDGALVVRMEGVDGKHDVRAVVASYEDFGTRILDAELIPEQEEPVELEPNEAEAARTEHEQEEDLEKAVTDIDGELEDLAEVIKKHDELQHATNGIINEALNSLNELVRQLKEGGEEIDHADGATLIQQQLSDTRKLLAIETTRREQEQRLAIKSGGEVAKLRRGVHQLNDERQVRLDEIIGQADKAIQGMSDNRMQLIDVINDAEVTASRIAGIVNEVAYSHDKHGYESYNGKLAPLVMHFSMQIERVRAFTAK